MPWTSDAASLTASSRASIRSRRWRPVRMAGGRLAFLVKRRGRTELIVMNADGTVRRLAEDLDVRGAPAWSPDGRWLAVAAANADGEPQLFKIPVGGGAPVSLVKEYSTDPVW